MSASGAAQRAAGVAFRKIFKTLLNATRPRWCGFGPEHRVKFAEQFTSAGHA
jgi:hypothetical protein